MNGEDPFAKLTELAHEALRMAVEESHALNHDYVGTEHLLLGLIRDVNGVAARVLQSLGISLKRCRDDILFFVDQGDHTANGDVALTPRCREVIGLAVDEMFQLNDRHFGSEHILLGLLREGDGIAGRVLLSLGVTLENAYREVALVAGRGEDSAAGKAERKPDGTPTVDQLDIDLTAQVQQGKVASILGRDREIERVIQILSRRRKSRVVLLGAPGSGQLAVVQGLAQRIVSHLVPEELQGKRLLTFHVGLIGAGTTSKAEFEDRLDTIMQEIRTSQDCIVVIEDVHLLVGPGPAEGVVDTARVLKPAVSGGEMQCICIATTDEYRRLVAADSVLHRRFETVNVSEKQAEEAPHGHGVAAERRDTRQERFAPFTTRSHWALSFAQEEAQCLNHNSIGTEHLLLGMIRDGDGIAAKALQSLGVQLPAARCMVALLIGRGDHIVRGYSGLSPRAQRVIELAVDEARRLNHRYVGTQHLLLGLVRDGEGVGVRVLETMGVSCEQVRTRTMEVLHRNGEAADPAGNDHG